MLAALPSRSTTSEISLPGERIDTFSELPLARIDSAALKPTACAVAWMLLAVTLPDSEPKTPRVVSFHEPEMLPPSLVMSLASSNL